MGCNLQTAYHNNSVLSSLLSLAVFFQYVQRFYIICPKSLIMKNAKIKKLLKAFAHILQSLLTASYLGAYRYHTLEPIEKIELHQEELSGTKLIKALVNFRHTKDEELSFVAKAVS